MHAKSCCFANLNVMLSVVLVAVAAVAAVVAWANYLVNCNLPSHCYSPASSFYLRISFCGGVYMTPGRVHSGFLSCLCICLHHTTTKCHADASHPGVSSPRLLYRGENFTPVRNLATLSCKRETTTRFGVKSVCRYSGTGSACVMLAILNYTCILSTWSVPSNNKIWNDPVIM